MDYKSAVLGVDCLDSGTSTDGGTKCSSYPRHLLELEMNSAGNRFGRFRAPNEKRSNSEGRSFS